jgi:hypothetical protein
MSFFTYQEVSLDIVTLQHFLYIIIALPIPF